MSYDIAKIDIFLSKTKHMGKSSGGVNGYSGAGATHAEYKSRGENRDLRTLQQYYASKSRD